MTNYSDWPGHVRCDQFRSGGKWYQTFQIDMGALWHSTSAESMAQAADRGNTGHLIFDAVRTAIEAKLGRAIEGDGMVYIVLDPYHENSHPIMLGARQ